MPAPSDDRMLPAPTAESPLLPWLLDVLQPMNRTRVKQLLRHGRVSVNGTTTTRHDHSLQPGDRVTIGRAVADRSLDEAGVAIVFEDDALIVIDKPPGLLTVATESEKIDTAFARLNAHLTARSVGRPFVVHRLDRETSGLLIFARTAEVRRHLQVNWEALTKAYLAIVEGIPKSPEGVVDNYLIEGRDLRVRPTRNSPSAECAGARHAVSHYCVVATHGKYTLVEVVLATGASTKFACISLASAVR